MEGEEGGMMMAGGYRYAAEVEAQDVLSPEEVERLVERFMQQQQRIEQLQTQNSKLTKELVEMGKAAPETLVIHVSPEMW